MPAVSMCRKLRMFGFNLKQWEHEKNPGQISKPLYLPFFESLSSLPKSLRSVSLSFPLVGPPNWSPHTFTRHAPSGFLHLLDLTLGGSEFSHLTCAELIWNISVSQEPDSFVDQVYRALQNGEFARCLNKLYHRGILWCGNPSPAPRAMRAYPISEPSRALAIHDRTAWKDSSRTCLFHRPQ